MRYLGDGRLLPEIIDQGEVYKRSGERLVYLFSDGRVYREALKKAKDGRENCFLPLSASSTDANVTKQVIAKYERIR